MQYFQERGWTDMPVCATVYITSGTCGDRDMASVNFMKIKTAGHAKAVLRHCDKEKRKKENHSNKDINLGNTDSNFQMDRSYEETCRLFDERIAFLDAQPGANKRKDRVICFGLDVPAPAGLAEEDEEDFFSNVSSIVEKQYGSENILQCYVHRDEKHCYNDAKTEQLRVSRVHAHFYVVPEHEGRLNGKWFSSRANMTKLNKSIHDMSQTEFGLDFMDGSKRKSTATVEELKGLSAVKAVRKSLDEQGKKQAETEKKQSENAQKLIDISNVIAEKEEEQNEREKALDAREKRLEAQEAALKQKEAGFDAERKEWGEQADKFLSGLKGECNVMMLTARNDVEKRHAAEAKRALEAKRRSLELDSRFGGVLRQAAEQRNAMDSQYGL